MENTAYIQEHRSKIYNLKKRTMYLLRKILVAEKFTTSIFKITASIP